MRYAVRALGWTIKILWILIIVFSVTAVYSALNVRMGFGEPQVFLSNESVVVSTPLFINNTGIYDLSDLNMTTAVTDYDQSLLATSTTFVPLISRGSSLDIAHNISMSLDDIALEAQTYLFNDTVFNVDMSAKLIFANAIPFQISNNMTIPWGAPLYNFLTGQISYSFLNFTHQEVVVPISFENHSPYFSVDGLIQVEIYNDNTELLGSSTSDLNVPSHSSYDGRVEIAVDISKITGRGEVRFYFETADFSFGPMVMPYG